MLNKLSKMMLGNRENQVGGITPWQDVGFLQKLGMGLGGADVVGDYQKEFREAQDSQLKKQKEQKQQSMLLKLAQGNNPEAMMRANANTPEGLTKLAEYLQEQNKPKDRKTIKGNDGFNYFQDTGERVLPDMEAPKDKPMSAIGKVNQDIRNGVITREQGQAQIAKLNAISGMSLEVGEDGTVRFGQGSAANNMEQATKNKVEGKLLDSLEMGSRVQSIKDSFNPAFLEFKNRAGNKWSAMKDFMGVDLNEDETKQLKGFTVFRRRAVSNMSRLLNEISGAAVSPDEYKRISKTMPNAGTDMFDGDSPIEFKAKMDDVLKDVQNANMRYNYALANGLNPMETKIEIDAMPDVFEERAILVEGEVSREMRGASDADIEAETRKRLKAEFGI